MAAPTREQLRAQAEQLRLGLVEVMRTEENLRSVRLLSRAIAATETVEVYIQLIDPAKKEELS